MRRTNTGGQLLRLPQREGERPNDPAKAVMYVVYAVGGVVALVGGVVTGVWWAAAVGALLIAICLVAFRLISQGRNPWWFQGPVDPKHASERRDRR